MGDDSLNGTLLKSVTDVSSLDPRSSAAVFLQAASMVVIMLVAVGGNLLILAAIYIDKTLQTITNAFIINLACADLLLSIIGMPFTLASSIKYEWIFGDTWCKVNGMANSLFCIASILTLAAVSVDRYCAILYPFKYVTWITNKVAAAMILYIWVHALLMACLPLTSWSRYTFISSESICTVQWEYSISFTLFLFSVCFFLPLGVMMITYLRIFRTARKQSRRIVPVTGEIEAREDPSITEYSACYRDDGRRAHINSELLTECTVKELDMSKSDISFNSDVYDDKMTPGRQTLFAVFDEQKEIGALSTENVNTTDQPSKDSGCEDTNVGGSRSFLKSNELPTRKEPRRTSSAYESLDEESVFNRSCRSLQESVYGPRESFENNSTSTPFESSDVNTPFSKSNNIATHWKTGAIYLPPIEIVKRKEEIESIMQRFDFNQPRAALESLNKNNKNVNESTKHDDVKCVDEDPSFAIETAAKKEDNLEEDNTVNQSNCRPTEGNAQVQGQHAGTDLADNKPLHIPVVVSRLSSQSSFAYSTKEAPPGGLSGLQTIDRNPSATRKKKLSSASLAGIVNFSGPNTFRAFSKSSLALVRLRKKRDVQSRAKMRRETKAAKTLLTVVGTFVLCWTPHFIGIFCFLFKECSWPDEFFAVTTWLAMLNSACNPVIYGVMSRQFRKRFKQILQCKRGFF